MALPVHFPALAGPDDHLSHALRLRTQGNLIEAAWQASVAAQVTGGAAFFEANALAAAITAQAGHIEASIAYWDKIIRSAPQKLTWLEAALSFACQTPGAEQALQRWQKLLANVFVAAPSLQVLALLQKNGFPLSGCIGIHAGMLKGWLWLLKGEKPQVCCEGARDYAISLLPKAHTQTHVLYAINQVLPEHVCLIALHGADGTRIGGSPAICWPPRARLKTGRPDKRRVTVLLPVYNDIAATLACLGSVLASRKRNKIKFQILVAWDNGPNPELLARLRKLATTRKIELVENKRNLGFLASVNNAITHIAHGDVILLNADTLVHGDWVDRLHEAAAAPNAATVTALGNEAELMSYPSMQDRGKVERLRQARLLDKAASLLPPVEATVPIPVGVGFCMYITRQCINRIGLLDGQFLFRGYGEEVDFCLRASEAGMVNYGAFNVFVAHLGERSFGLAKRALAAQNNAAIFERFPKYRQAYEMFSLYRQPKELRRRIALATLANVGPLPALELRPWFCRYLPPWVKDERYKPNKRGAAIFIRPGPHPRALLRVWAELPVMEMEFELPAQTRELAQALADLEYAGAVACGLAAPVRKLAENLGIEFSVQDCAPDLPQWREREERLLAAPPPCLNSFRMLCGLAAKWPQKSFFVFHIDSLWAGAPRPGNIVEVPGLEDYRPLQPQALLMLANFFDAQAWQDWLAAHGCADLPIYGGCANAREITSHSRGGEQM